MTTTSRRPKDDRGGAGAESTAWLLLLPVTLLLLFGGFQAAQWWQARQATVAAAQAACEQARTVTGGDPDRAMNRIVAQSGLTDVSLSVSSTPTTVTCTVNSRVPLVVDLASLGGQLEETVTMPREGERV